jgi:uncharacterized membrane protein (UPF0182 family)
MLLLLAIATIIIIGVLGFASLHLLDVATFTSADYLLLLLVLVIIQVLLKGFVNNHVIEDEPNSKAPPAV